eukprot:1570000-Amphidinium_carterae.1
MAGRAQATLRTIPLQVGPAWGWPTKPRSRPVAIRLIGTGRVSGVVGLPLGTPSGSNVKRRALANPPNLICIQECLLNSMHSMEEGPDTRTNQQHYSKEDQDFKGAIGPTFVSVVRKSFSALVTGLTSGLTHGYACESGCVFAFLGRKVFSTALELDALEASPAFPGVSPACSNM